MDLVELDFTEICRCCKRTNSEMISIFDVNADPTYPPVDEMLISIASLNVQENDGLPSLVCTLCLNNIQDAFTFILQITLIDEQLSQMFARRKQADTLQDTYGICESVKIEEDEYESDQAGAADSEDVKLLLKVEDLDESMQDCYQHRSADNRDENIDVMVQAEGVLVSEFEGAKKLQAQSEQWEELNFGTSMFACKVCNQEFKTTQQLENHKIIYCVESESSAITIPRPKEDIQEYYSESIMEDEEISLQLRVKQLKTTSKASNHADVPDKEKEPSPLILLQNEKVLENMMKSYSHTGNNNLSVNDDDCLLMVQKTVDLEDFEDVDEDYEEIDEICQKSPKQGNLTAKIHTVYKCNLCAYSSAKQSRIKRHLQIHCKEQPYTCSKCNGKFASRHYMLHHKRNCKRKITHSHGERIRQAAILVISPQDLDDPLIMNKYYTVTGICVQHNNNDVTDVTEHDGSKFTVFKCNLCGYTCNCISYLNRHLRSHSKQRFTCSKCKRTFSRKYNMLQHRGNCSGKNTKQRKDILNQVIPFKDLKDPLKMEKYFTVTKIDVQNNNGDNVKVQRPKGGREEVEIKQISSKSRRNQRTSTSKFTVFKCKLCAYTSMILTRLKKHLYTHCKVKPFACSKCNRTFSHSSLLRYHKQNCNGRADPESQAFNQVIPVQNLQVPLKMKMYYTSTDIDM